MSIRFQLFNKSYWSNRPKYYFEQYYSDYFNSINDYVRLFWQIALKYSPNLSGVVYTPITFSDGTFLGYWENEKKQLIGWVLKKDG